MSHDPPYSFQKVDIRGFKLMSQHLVITRSSGPLEDLRIRFKGNTMTEINTIMLFVRLADCACLPMMAAYVPSLQPTCPSTWGTWGTLLPEELFQFLTALWFPFHAKQQQAWLKDVIFVVYKISKKNKSRKSLLWTKNIFKLELSSLFCVLCISFKAYHQKSPQKLDDT